MTVDLIQNSKKAFINLYIKNPELKQAWTDYVNDQTEFIHRALETGNKVSLVINNELERCYNMFNKNWDDETTQSNKQSQ